MVDKWLWIAGLFVSACIGALLGRVLNGTDIGVLVWIEDHEGLAAWLQFAGAMLAIVVAWFVAHREAKRAENELAEARAREAAALNRTEAAEAERLQALRNAAGGLIATLSNRLAAAKGAVKDAPPELLNLACKIHASDVRAMDSQMEAFPFWQMGSVHAVQAFVSARAILNESATLLETSVGVLSMGSGNLAHEIGRLVDRLDTAIQILVALRNE